jgi:hypothetical protein
MLQPPIRQSSKILPPIHRVNRGEVFGLTIKGQPYGTILLLDCSAAETKCASLCEHHDLNGTPTTENGQRLLEKNDIDLAGPGTARIDMTVVGLVQLQWRGTPLSRS